MNRHELTAWFDARRDVWFDLLRIYLGIGLFIRGLIFFLGDGQVMFQNFVGENSFDWFTSSMAVHYVMLAHTCGGILLAFGLLTRVAALAQVPVLVGAILVHAPDGIFALGQSLEFAAFVLVALLVVIAHGSGRLSVDYYTFGPGRRREPIVHHTPGAAHNA